MSAPPATRDHRIDAPTADAEDDIVAALGDAARSLVDGEKDLKAYRARSGRAPGHHAVLQQQLRELGWHAALIHEPLGGSGLRLAAAAAIAEPLGRGLLGDVLVATSVLPVLLLQHRSARPGAEGLLRAIASGDRVAAVAWQERAVCIDPAAITSRAIAAGAGFSLTGSKRWVVGGTAATDLLVTARLDDGVAVFRVDADADGLSRELCWQADGTAALAIAFDELQVGADALLVPSDRDAVAVAHALDATAVVACAELMGIVDAAFDMTIAYLKTRVQYDRPIGSFQALQHMAVDLLVQRELARAVLEEALALFDGANGVAESARRRVAWRCKARCSDAALLITRACIQLHGAIGYTDDYDLGLYLKRALVLSAWLGNGEQQRERAMRRAD